MAWPYTRSPTLAVSPRGAVRESLPMQQTSCPASKKGWAGREKRKPCWMEQVPNRSLECSQQGRHRYCLHLRPTAVTLPAQSLPGAPGSPGYKPRTLSTSLKFKPTAATVSITCNSTKRSIKLSRRSGCSHGNTACVPGHLRGSHAVSALLQGLPVTRGAAEEAALGAQHSVKYTPAAAPQLGYRG